MIPRDNQFDIEFLKRRIREMDWSSSLVDLPPADPICFQMAKLGEPTITYEEFVKRWREKTFKLRNKQ